MSAREKLQSWVDGRLAEGLNRTQVAAEIGCSESALSRWLSGGRKEIDGRSAAAIERATGGLILAIEWYPERAA